MFILFLRGVDVGKCGFGETLVEAGSFSSSSYSASPAGGESINIGVEAADSTCDSWSEDLRLSLKLTSPGASGEGVIPSEGTPKNALSSTRDTMAKYVCRGSRAWKVALKSLRGAVMTGQSQQAV